MTRAEAQKQLRAIVGQVGARKALSRTSSVTVRRFVEDEYLVQCSREWKGSTAGTTEHLVRSHIVDEIGDLGLSAVTRKDLQALLDRKAAVPLSYSIVAHIRWQLSAIFKMARADGLVALEPALSLCIPVKQSHAPKPVIALEQIIRAQMALDMRERLVLRLAVCEGMRPGEIVGLQVGDITAAGISVERRVYRGTVDTPKSARSQRLIPPTPATRDLLRGWLDLLGETAPEAWVFASENGFTPIDYGNLYRRRIQPALARVGLGNVNYQILRRTWVTEFSQVESDPHIRAQIAGHSVDVHENEYRQGNREAMAKSMARLGERLH